jgi:hypothetical protein
MISMNDYWLVVAGHNTLDDGVFFFLTPTFTQVLIIDRASEKIVDKKLFFRDLTNARIINNELYFRYYEPFLWTILTNINRLGELDSDMNNLAKTNLSLD